MTEETNEPNESANTPEKEATRKLIVTDVPPDTKADANSSANEVAKIVPQLPNSSEEAPVIRKLITPDQIAKSSDDPDGERGSPGLTERGATEALKPDKAEETPGVQELITPDQIAKPSDDPDGERGSSPSLVDERAAKALEQDKAEEGS